MIETNYTAKMILSNKDYMKYSPAVVMCEQQKRSESSSVLSSSLGPGWPKSRTTSETLPLLNNSEDAINVADMADVLNVANEIYRTRVVEDYILLKRELLMFLVADIDPANEALFTCKQVSVRLLGLGKLWFIMNVSTSCFDNCRSIVSSCLSLKLLQIVCGMRRTLYMRFLSVVITVLNITKSS